jgi:hypothetical protein
VFTPMDRCVFSLMCQHGVGSEGHWKPSSFSFLVLRTFYKQRVSVTLQCVQAISILNCAVIIGEGASRPNVLLGGCPFSLFDMLVMTIRRG